MSYRLLIFDEVLNDVKEAKEWYRNQHEGLELLFASAIEQCLNKLLQTPKSYSLRYKNVRIAHPKKFPYNIHFYVDESKKTVVVIAIIHNRRNPKTGSKRVS
jgi:plasmid stabilization system protein ParE